MILNEIKSELQNISKSHILPIYSFTIEESENDILKGIENFEVIGFMKPREIQERNKLFVTYYFPEENKETLLKSFDKELGNTHIFKNDEIKIKKETVSIYNNKLPNRVGKIIHEYQINSTKPDKNFVYLKFKKAFTNHFYRFQKFNLNIESIVEQKKFIGLIINDESSDPNKIRIQYYSKKTNRNQLANDYRTTIGDIERKLLHYVRRIQKNSKVENFNSVTYTEHEYEIL